MAKVNFTDKFINGLKAEPQKYYVREGRGFAVQVRPTGLKTFVYIYEFGGKRKYFLLGNYGNPEKDHGTCTLAQARLRYNEAYNKVAVGIDPQAENEPKPVPVPAPEPGMLPEDPTVAQIAQKWLDTYSKTVHSADWHYTMCRAVKNDILPVLGNRLVASVRRREVVGLIEIIAKRAPGQARNVLKALQGLFEYAEGREYIESSPCLRITKHVPAARQKPKKRTLSEDEIRIAWCGIDRGPGSDATKRALKMILVTMQRPAEVAQMHWDQIDGDWWTVPAMIIGNKRERENRVFLCPLAKTLLGDKKAGPVFPGRGGRNSVTRLALSQLVSRGEVTDEVIKVNKGNRKQHSRVNKYFGLPRWTPHDLRRTGRSMLPSLGVINEVAEEVINHEKEGMNKIYNLYTYDAEKRIAVMKWDEKLRQILGDLLKHQMQQPQAPAA